MSHPARIIPFERSGRFPTVRRPTTQLSSFAGTGAKVTTGAMLPALDEQHNSSIGGVDDAEFSVMFDRVMDLCTFEAGWDGYGAKAIDNDTAVYAMILFGGLQKPGMVRPFIAPLAHGGLQFEWNTPEIAVEVEVVAPLHVIVLIDDLVTGEAVEQDFAGAAVNNLASVLDDTVRGRLSVREQQHAEQRRA